MPTHPTPAGSRAKPTAFTLFVAAVASFSAAFGVIAVAHRVGRSYYVAYDGLAGHIQTEATPRWSVAVYRAEKAALDDMVYGLD